LKEKINIGLLAFVRSTYDVKKGNEIYQDSISFIKRNIEDINLYGLEKSVEFPEELDKEINNLKNKKLDGIIIMSATFHLGQLAIKVAKNLNVPLLIWALPEPPYNGGRVRLNSLVGAHLDCSNLYKAGFDKFEFIYGEIEDEKFIFELNNWLDSLRIIKKWNNTKIGYIGNHAHGFYNIDVYEPEIINQFGSDIEYIPLNTVFTKKAKVEEIKEEEANIKKLYKYSESMTDDRLEKVANLSLTFKDLQESNHYEAMAVRCWPEFAGNYGISPCASMSYFMPGHVPIACEGDIEGALGMIAYKSIGCNEIFLADVSQIFEKESALLFWHCGVAPYNLWDNKSEKTLDTYFAGGKGVTVGFVLKPGPVTISRIDYAKGKFRLLVAKGEAIPMDKELKGTFVKVKIPEAKEFLEKIVSKGISHHVVLGYGDYSQSLKKVARLKKWEIIE